MLLSLVMTVLLLASSVAAAPTNSSSSAAADDDPLEVSETGHSMRRRLWRRLLKQVSGGGLGGGYGPGYGGLNILAQLAQLQNYNNLGPHRGPTVYEGVGGYGGNVLHYPGHPVGGSSYGGYYRPLGEFPVHPGQRAASLTSYGTWDSGAWGLLENYGLGGPDGLHFDTVWL